MPYVELESNALIGSSSRVWYVAEDGTRTELSGALTGADIHISVKVGELNRITLHGLISGISTRAEVEDVILNVIPRDKIPDVIARLRRDYEAIGDKALRHWT